jgi:hypothetical protein
LKPANHPQHRRARPGGSYVYRTLKKHGSENQSKLERKSGLHYNILTKFNVFKVI